MSEVPYISLISILIASLSLLISIVSLRRDHRRRKKQATIEFMNNLSKEIEKYELFIKHNFKDNLPSYNEINNNIKLKKYINRVLFSYEQLSVGVNTNVFDLDIIDRMSGSHIINLFTLLNNYIYKKRETPSRRKSYIEFEELVNAIKKRRSEYKNIDRLAS